jgi:Mrp family chromosome partitioning ATPase
MSTLDQAFIRAYQAGTRRAEKPTPAAPPVAAPVAAMKPAAPPKPAATATPTATATRTTILRQHFVDESHAQSTAAPHYADPVSTEHHARLAERLAQINRLAATGEPEPMVEAVDEEVVVAERMRAAFETQRFTWPRNVEVLIASAGNEFGEFAHELAERSAAGRKTLAVTGVDRTEGRTTLLLALARMAATRGLRTVLVDLDLRAPNLAEQLGLRPELGWDDAYAERMQPSDALIESVDDRISLLPLRNGPANPRSLAGNTFLRGAIEDLREQFDLVLLDVGPLTDDQQTIDLAAALCGSPLDDALVVRDRRRTTPKQVQEACRRLAVLGIHRWDVAENFCEIRGY